MDDVSVDEAELGVALAEVEDTVRKMMGVEAALDGVTVGMTPVRLGSKSSSSSQSSGSGNAGTVGMMGVEVPTEADDVRNWPPGGPDDVDEVAELVAELVEEAAVDEAVGETPDGLVVDEEAPVEDEEPLLTVLEEVRNWPPGGLEVDDAVADVDEEPAGGADDEEAAVLDAVTVVLLVVPEEVERVDTLAVEDEAPLLTALEDVRNWPPGGADDDEAAVLEAVREVLTELPGVVERVDTFEVAEEATLLTLADEVRN
jgi:hypothetical protein